MSNLLKIQEKIIKIAQESQESVDIHNITKRAQIHNLNDNQMRKYIPIKYTWDKNHPDYEPPITRSRSS